MMDTQFPIGLLVTSLTVCSVVCQSPVLEFEVMEELPNNYIGSIATSLHLTSRYDVNTIARFSYELTADFSQDASLYTLDSDTGDLRTSSTGIDRETHCAGSDDCDLYINIAIAQPQEFFEVLPLFGFVFVVFIVSSCLCTGLTM